MQKLIIRETFLGVKPCEIEFDRFLLLIGEQASGKSTIAKLIYFFQSLPETLYNSSILSVKRNEIYSRNKNFHWVIRNLFYETFGSTYHLTTNFEVLFYFNDTNYCKINRGGDKKAYCEFSTIMNEDINTCLKSFFIPRVSMLNGTSSDEIYLRQELLNSLNISFSRLTTNSNYLIAGRNTIVALPEYFEEKMMSELEKLLEDEVKQQDLQRKNRVGNERLILKFVQWSQDIRKYFKNNGGDLNSVKSGLRNQVHLGILQTIFKKILKGEYSTDSYGEILQINAEEKVYVKDASSGQQEVLRVLQTLFLTIGLHNRREFMVIEEPEAHLYPTAQKEIINAFALFLNTIQEGRLIITTHSPYILACVNILLYAHYVSKEVGNNENEISKSVQKDFWLDSKMFNAYSLGHQGEYCQNIKDTETGLIDQNYLDAISEALGMQFHQLHKLLFEAHA